MKKLFPIITEFDSHLPYYFAGVGVCYSQENIYRPDGYPAYQWIQCRKGCGELTLNGCKYTIEYGQGMLLFPDEPHEYHAVNGDWEVDWIIFKGRLIEDFILNTVNINTSQVYYITTPHLISDKISELYEAANSTIPTKNLICSSIVYSILIDVFRFTSSTQNTSIVNKVNRINPVLKFIDENYYRHLTLDELAKTACLTPQYLCTAFKKSTSQTLFEYINMVRVQKSKELLIYSSKQIKEIALEVGFHDISYFCSTFKKFESISPTEFRTLHN